MVYDVNAQRNQVDCDSQKMLLDGAVDNMTMLLNEWETGFTSVEDLNNEYCIPFPEWFRVMNAYKRCLKAFPRTLFAFVGTNIKKIYKEFCMTEEKRIFAYSHLSCMKPSNKKFFTDISIQVRNFADFMSKVPIDDVIPGFCCGYLNLTNDFEERFENECTRQGKQGSGRFISNIIKSLFIDSIDIMCGKYSKPDDCNEPRLGRMLDDMLTQSRNRTKFPFKSPVVPVLKILDRMDGKVNLD